MENQVPQDFQEVPEARVIKEVLVQRELKVYKVQEEREGDQELLVRVVLPVPLEKMALLVRKVHLDKQELLEDKDSLVQEVHQDCLEAQVRVVLKEIR